MKKIYITLVTVFAITQFSYAQWQDGTNIYNTNSGNVGIGTTAPQAKLHLVGPASGGGRFKIETLGAFAGTDEAKIDFQFYTDGVDSPQAQIKAIGTTGYTGDLVFSTMYNGTFPNLLREVMRLQGTTGNVGIGTTSPTRLLDIVSGTGVGPLKVSGPNGSLLIDNVGSGQSYYQANAFHQFQGTSGNPILTMQGGGNVGIGTTTPANKFVVENNGNSNNYHMAGFYNNSTAPGAVAGIEIMAGNAGVGGGGLLFYKGNGQSSDPNGFFIDNSQNAPLGLMTNNTERMRISSSGNVGIGTTTPDQKLTVNGTIHAKQINVDLNVPGPDYVFKKGYKLKTLPEINRYIILNKHLPEIPSAKSMEQSGINVSELNMKLLQKIEELTLYMIEKDKQVNELQSELSTLKKQMTAITKVLNKN